MNVIKVNEDNYDDFIKKGICVTKIGADWCAPCRAMEPVLEQIAKEYGDKITVGIIDVDESRDLASKLAVSNIPVISIFKNGVLAFSKKSALPPMAIKNEIDKLL